MIRVKQTAHNPDKPFLPEGDKGDLLDETIKELVGHITHELLYGDSQYFQITHDGTDSEYAEINGVNPGRDHNGDHILVLDINNGAGEIVIRVGRTQ